MIILGFIILISLESNSDYHFKETGSLNGVFPVSTAFGPSELLVRC